MYIFSTEEQSFTLLRNSHLYPLLLNMKIPKRSTYWGERREHYLSDQPPIRSMKSTWVINGGTARQFLYLKYQPTQVSTLSSPLNIIKQDTGILFECKADKDVHFKAYWQNGIPLLVIIEYLLNSRKWNVAYNLKQNHLECSTSYSLSVSYFPQSLTNSVNDF